MDRLLTDLEEIGRIFESDSEDNYKFRTFIKSHLKWSDRKLDAVVHEILRSVSAAIDCTACANCCRTMSVEVDLNDIVRLAARLGMSVQVFKDRHVSDGDFAAKQISQIPCPFLEGYLCTVYEDRPKDCREFPHLNKRNVRSRSIALIENGASCPVVYNVLHELKRRIDWKRRG
jgi:uncharacterized protein